VLAMIEINLLPPEYRPREKTNFPLMMTVAAGMLVVGAIILYGIKLNNELAALNSEHKSLSKAKVELEADVKRVRELKGKIAREKARQDTIIEISQSKVMWSLKLQQLSQLMDQFPGFWVQRMTLTKSTKGATLDMQVSATGSSLREVARFRDALKNDPNFYYHFDDLVSLDVRIVELPKDKYNFSEQMDFTVKLPLQTAVIERRR